MTLDNTARSVLRAVGGWPIADCLLDPKTGCAHLRASFMGGTYLAGFPEGTGYQCEKRGIVVQTLDVVDQDVVRTEVTCVTWKQIDTYAWTIPMDVRRELRAARDEHQRVHMLWVGRTNRQCDGLAWEHHLVQTRAARARLDRALAAALADEVTVAEPEQLDMFASAS